MAKPEAHGSPQPRGARPEARAQRPLCAQAEGGQAWLNGHPRRSGIVPAPTHGSCARRDEGLLR